MASIFPTALEVLTTVCLSQKWSYSANKDIQRLHLDAPVTSYIKSSMEALHPQHVSNALYGISGLFDESVPSTVIIYRYLKSHFDRVVAVDSNQLSLKDRRMLTSHVCLFIGRIQHNGSVISSQLSAELIEIGTTQDARPDHYQR